MKSRYAHRPVADMLKMDKTNIGTAAPRRLKRDDYNGLVANLAIVTVTWRDIENTCGCIWSVLNSNTRPAIMVVVENGSGPATFHGIKDFLLGRELEIFDPFTQTKQKVSIDKFEDRFSLQLGTAGADWTGPLSISPNEGKTQIVLFAAAENRGFSAGNNVGVALLASLGFNGAIWLLNNDAYVAPDCVDALCSRSLQAELPEIFGTVLVEFSDCDRIQSAGGVLTKCFASPHNLLVGERLSECRSNFLDGAVKADYPIGASLFTWTHIIACSSHAFFEGYFLYFEEADYAFERAVMRSDIYLDARVAHLGGASTGNDLAIVKSKRNAFRDFYSARARVIFVRRHRRSILLPVISFIILQALKRVATQDYAASVSLFRGLWLGLTYDTRVEARFCIQ